jgi:hypothetical protein
LLERYGPLPRLRRCLHCRAGDNTSHQQHQKRSGHSSIKFLDPEGSGVNWSARPQTKPILCLRSP